MTGVARQRASRSLGESFIRLSEGEGVGKRGRTGMAARSPELSAPDPRASPIERASEVAQGIRIVYASKAITDDMPA